MANSGQQAGLVGVLVGDLFPLREVGLCVGPVSRGRGVPRGQPGHQVAGEAALQLAQRRQRLKRAPLAVVGELWAVREVQRNEIRERSERRDVGDGLAAREAEGSELL